MFKTIQPQVLEKASPVGPFFIRMLRSITHLDYSELFWVCARKHGVEIPLRKASWADWDGKGRLVFARDGKILAGSFGPDFSFKEFELADFNRAKPESVEPPRWAHPW